MMKTKTYTSALFLLLFLFSSVVFAQEGKERDYEIAVTKGQYETELGHYDAAIGYLSGPLR